MGSQFYRGEESQVTVDNQRYNKSMFKSTLFVNQGETGPTSVSSGKPYLMRPLDYAMREQ